MPAIFPGYVRCSFGPVEKITSHQILPVADAFVLKASDFGGSLIFPEEKLNRDDIEKAGRIKNADYRRFILNCYTLLRLILSRRLKCKPEEIVYETLTGGKPVIPGNPLFFNISHTRTGFAFIITDGFHNGIDIEEINPNMNFVPVIERFFSPNEVRFILESEVTSRERFYILWTRKEALLKSIGTGIIDNLSTVEVHKGVNKLYRNMFACLDDIKRGVYKEMPVNR